MGLNSDIVLNVFVNTNGKFSSIPDFCVHFITTFVITVWGKISAVQRKESDDAAFLGIHRVSINVCRHPIKITSSRQLWWVLPSPGVGPGQVSKPRCRPRILPNHWTLPEKIEVVFVNLKQIYIYIYETWKLRRNPFSLLPCYTTLSNQLSVETD